MIASRCRRFLRRCSLSRASYGSSTFTEIRLSAKKDARPGFSCDASRIKGRKGKAMRLQLIHFVLSAVAVAVAPQAWAQGGSQDPIWSSNPVRVDKSQQSMERLPAKPAQELAEPDPGRYPLKLKRTLPFRIIDSVSFVHDGKKYRLIDLEPVPVAKTCREDSGQRWACGLKSRIALTALLRGKQILCAPSGEKDGFTLVECARSSKDIGSLMAEAGQALAVGPHYQAEQDIARREKAGVWGDTAAAAY
jgi:hypothetical protein